jgi:hypothetical protein
MLGAPELRSVSDGYSNRTYPLKTRTLDLNDPATQGCLLALLREGLADEGVVISSGEDTEANLWGLTRFSGGNILDLGSDWTEGLKPLGEALTLALVEVRRSPYK